MIERLGGDQSIAAMWNLPFPDAAVGGTNTSTTQFALRRRPLKGKAMANLHKGGQQKPIEESPNGGGPSAQGAGNTTGQQGSAQGGQDGKQGSSESGNSNDNAGNSRDANKADNKSARKNKEAGK
jgi:hypothetical protein